MGWTQENITEVYRSVKQVAAGIDPDGKTGATLKHEIKQRVRYKLGFYRVRRTNTGGYVTYADHGSNRELKSFVRGKYHKMGLPSREQDMLSKMIDSVVESMKVNETTLGNLVSTVSKAEVAAARAKTIVSDCEDIMSELTKISDYLDGEE